MPAAGKASWARLKVGVMAVVGMAILALVIFLITGSHPLFQSYSTLYTYMNDATGLTQGAPVTLNGLTIGAVKDVQLSTLSDPQKAIKITLQVEDQFLSAIPVDSLTELSAANLLGAKFVNINKGTARQTVQDNTTLATLNTRGFEDVVKQGYSVLSSLQLTVNKVNDIVDQIQSGKGSIGKLLVDETLYNRLLDIVTEVQKIATALNSTQGTLGKLVYDPALYNQVQGSLGRVDSLLAGLQQGEGTAGKLLKDPELYNQVRDSVQQMHQLLTDLNAGKGTAGKLLKSDELANQISATVSRLDTMLDKINAGQGTIGQLLVNQQLYDNLNGATRQLNLLMQDFRANPKKFLRIKLAIF
ncbi:MAG TPA: MlaD family protein [Bryobacteraceae bacterium]|nr:MlaD family protein [Bryobacteraceae bacterium]